MDERFENRPESDADQSVQIVEVWRLLFGVLLKVTDRWVVLVNHLEDRNVVTPKSSDFSE